MYINSWYKIIEVEYPFWCKIATRDLLPELAGTRLTPKVCSRVSDAFVEKYGKYAGWAQTLLFIAELPSQKALLQSLTNETKDAVKDEIVELQQSVVKGNVFILFSNCNGI